MFYPPGTQACLAPLLLFLRFYIIRARASGLAFLKWLRSVDIVCCVRTEPLLFERASIKDWTPAAAPLAGTIPFAPDLAISGKKVEPATLMMPWGALDPISEMG
jgi:hypothetical protein